MPFSPNPHSPHGELLLELSQQSWAQWQHHPISKAFFAFLEDQHLAFRELAADLLEAGAYRVGAPHEDQNPDVVRGKLLQLKQLSRIGLTDIQSFYGKEEPSEQQDQSPA